LKKKNKGADQAVTLILPSEGWESTSQGTTGYCRNPFSLGLKRFFPDLSGFAKGFLAKNVLMTAQRDFRLGNSLSTLNLYSTDVG
jgi:hypothetical protein